MKGPRRSVRGFSFWWLALSLRDSIQAMSSAYRIIVPHDPAQFPSTALVTPRATPHASAVLSERMPSKTGVAATYRY
jgi:hypothetical protein